MKRNSKELIKNNKGFSLVELIVVMAIMAILVGALAPQVIKYVEGAREAKDVQLENAIFTGVQTAIGSSQNSVGAFTFKSIEAPAAADVTADATEWKKIYKMVQEVSGFSTNSGIWDKLTSRKGCTASDGTVGDAAADLNLVITYDANGKISVKIGTLDAVTN